MSSLQISSTFLRECSCSQKHRDCAEISLGKTFQRALDLLLARELDAVPLGPSQLLGCSNEVVIGEAKGRNVDVSIGCLGRVRKNTSDGTRNLRQGSSNPAISAVVPDNRGLVCKVKTKESLQACLLYSS